MYLNKKIQSNIRIIFFYEASDNEEVYLLEISSLTLAAVS